MKDNIASAGGSVLDALRTIPGVTIGEEGRILLRGSDRVPVLVDGKPSALTGIGNQTALDSIPAGNIERIEIINNPSARYDAAGMAGIINIVYRQDRALGWSGDAGMSAGVGALSKRREDIPSRLGSWDSNYRYAPSFSVTYNADALKTFLQAEFIQRRDLPNNEFTTRYYDDGRVRYSQIPENRKQQRYIAKGGVDLHLTEADTLGFSTAYDWEHHNDFADIPYLDEQLRTTRRWFWMEDEITGFFNTQLNWRREFQTPGRRLSASVQYTRGWEDESYFLNEESPIRIGTDATRIIATEHTIPVTLDYVHPLRAGRIETGLKFQSRRLPLTYEITPGFQSVIYPGLGDESNWEERIYASYANLVHESRRYALEGGLRAEETDVRYELAPENIYYPRNDQYDYFRLFANARFTVNFTGNTRASLFYNDRVDRPGEPELRVFPKYDDPELLKVGNPYLRPQFTRTYEARIEHNWDDATASASVFRRHITDPFTRVYATDSTSTQYEIINKTYHNTGRATQTGLEILASKRMSARWNLSGSVNWFRNELDAYDVDLLFPVPRTISLGKSSGTTWDFKANTQLLLPWELKLQMSGVYYAARNIAQGRQSARSSIDAGLTKKIIDRRGEIALTATDIFNRFGIEQRIEGDGFNVLYQNFHQTQAVTLSMKYGF
jgi:hypothetical protein